MMAHIAFGEEGRDKQTVENLMSQPPLLFEPHGLASDRDTAWRMFQITGSLAAVIMWVRPATVYCEVCGTAFVVHEDSVALIEKAIGQPLEGGQVVCLCEGRFLE